MRRVMFEALLNRLPHAWAQTAPRTKATATEAMGWRLIRLPKPVQASSAVSATAEAPSWTACLVESQASPALWATDDAMSDTLSLTWPAASLTVSAIPLWPARWLPGWKVVPPRCCSLAMMRLLGPSVGRGARGLTQ